MKQYVLNTSTYNREELSFTQIYNLDECEKDISTLINYFNSEYKWDGMFDLNECDERLSNKNILFILKLNDAPIGYVWFKELNSNTCFGYNLYVTKKVKRPSYAPRWFYNKVSGIMLEKYDNINVEIEDWNSVVFDLVESIGYYE